MCGLQESCGTWRKENNILTSGCILNEYCGIDAEFEGQPTKFTCP